MRLPTRLLQRKLNSHKGDFGHIFILAGSPRFSGASVLCAEAAMRSGAGLVTLGIPKSLNSAIIKIKSREAMTLPLSETKAGALGLAAFKEIDNFLRKIDVLAVGPGLGDDKSTQALVRKVISKTSVSLVIDADGLNALAGHLDILGKPRTENREPILTPHPGEMAKLLDTSVDKIQGKRKEVAKALAKDYNCVVVLKGQKTIVAGSGGKVYINQTGNPGMATAGSGDVLTGIIAAFLGQGLNPFEAAKYAVYLHGLSGDLAAGEKTEISLIASDIVDKIPNAIKKMQLVPA